MSLADELRSLPTDSKTLKKFGFVFGVISLLLGLWSLWTGRFVPPIFFGAALFFGALGLWFPRLLKEVYCVWMAVGLCLGWVMARVLLSVLFYALMTPLAVLLRWTKKDLLKLRSEAQESYWVVRPGPSDKESYKNQY
jgi:hypothetical protein